ncbi:unnamed protein product [Vicia faba]|uniref:RPW8 domain-containing protein n=1 Tax=Vicia faba TaxID=3906 RepID=A0AAV1AIA0_VICFA|nr:unnamed protein product [Vicia faba]
MAGGLVEGAVLGAVFQEGTKPITNQISKAWNFRKTRKNLASLVHRIMPAAKQMKLLDEKLVRPTEETDRLIQEIEQGRESVNKLSNVPWWKCCCLPCYQGELHDEEEKIARSSSLVTPFTMARDVKETLSIVTDIKGRQFNRLCDAPVKPHFTIGLDFPLNQLKNWLLSKDRSVRVLTGLAGSGKTTLASLLCWDQQVRGKFGQNILFFTVSKTPNLKNIVQNLFQHCGHDEPCFVDDDDAVKNLSNLLTEIGESCPLMMVLDNVPPGLESFVEAFQVQVPDCKILITSRVEFPRFETTSLRPLSLVDAITLFSRFALPNDGKRGTYVPDEEYLQEIAKGCWGSPLALKLIGGSLCGQPIAVWKKMVSLLSRGRSIVFSNNDLLSRLQKVLEEALEDNHIIKECFMDLGLFFEDKKIPVAALIDMWTELNNLDDDNIDGMNIVHDLDNLHLVNLVVAREVTSHVDNYYNHHFLTQHDLLKEIAIHQARQEPYEHRKRLIFDMKENSWDRQNKKNTVARTLSISTDKMLTPDWSNIVKVERVEVSVPSLCTLNRLRKLSLYNCKTRHDFQSETISVSKVLPNLEELCIDYCKDLVTLPVGLCYITSLKKLSITRCINFLVPPQEIGNLENLKVLRLSSCAELGEMPASIGNLHELHFLDISGCASLHTLPEEIGNLHNLKELHMTSFSTLPWSVTKLESLKYLICDQETAQCWEHFKPSLPNLKIEEAEVNLFIIV